MEELGVSELAGLGMVLIAGGLGERLGYKGLKIDLPITVLDPSYTFLKYAIDFA